MQKKPLIELALLLIFSHPNTNVPSQTISIVRKGNILYRLGDSVSRYTVGRRFIPATCYSSGRAHGQI